jgi:hypothetical protein
MDLEKRIREIAYSLWVAEGYPVGQEDRHWRIAEQMAAEEDRRRLQTKEPLEPKPAISDEAAIGDNPESRGDPYIGSAK